jgi:hypothetical protein
MLCISAILLAVVVSGVGGYLYGRKFGDVQAYLIGLEQGQADGMATAQAAYESGGEIVNVTTGQRTRKPNP